MENFEWSDFSDRKRAKPNWVTLCKQSAPSASASVTQNLCVEFFLNFDSCLAIVKINLE